MENWFLEGKMLETMIIDVEKAFKKEQIIDVVSFKVLPIARKSLQQEVTWYFTFSNYKLMWEYMLDRRENIWCKQFK